MIPSESFCHGRHDSFEPEWRSTDARDNKKVLHSRICLAFRVVLSSVGPSCQRLN